MHDKRICSAPSDQTKRIERAILALLIAEDHPWPLSELQKRLGHPLNLVQASVARLQADGLLTDDGQTVRASRAAIRCDELTLYTFRPGNH
jgi:DNA-binding IclR family transcriptional regulator